MVTDEAIKKIAWFIWEAEGRPIGRHLDHYYRAKRMLEENDRILTRIRRIQKHSVSWERCGLNQ